MRNATSRIKEATSALQFELLQQIEALDNDRDTIRTRLTADIKRLTAENDTQAAEIKTQAADNKALEADLYDEEMKHKKTKQDLKKAEQDLKEERTRNYANRNAIQKT
jgi:beta-galactosidase/beta-glucuronidase